MAISPRLEEFLKKSGVSYEAMHHSAAYTASEIASAQHVPGREMIKSVIVKAGDSYLMCVLPAIHMIDFAKLEKATGVEGLELASEEEITRLFPDYDKGAEPPFGSLYNLKVYIDASIGGNTHVVLNAGTHTDVVKMSTQDYLDLAGGVSADFGKHI